MEKWITLFILMAAFAIYVAIDKAITKRRASNDADEKDTRELSNIKGLLTLALPALFTEAENRYLEPGSGELKHSFVVAEAMKLIPSAWRACINADWLHNFIEQALPGARTIWDSHPFVLIKEQIERCAADAEFAGELMEKAVTEPAE